MDQASIVYRHNTSPRRGLATAGIFLIKAIMAIPHLILINGLSTLAFGAAYVGYWVVAFRGTLPGTFQDFMTWYLRWQTRTFGWYFGNEDAYPRHSIYLCHVADAIKTNNSQDCCQE
ncbi:MAG: DUF4389 domain-containing protein [Desulfocurvibacter africanus]